MKRYTLFFLALLLTSCSLAKKEEQATVSQPSGYSYERALKILPDDWEPTQEGESNGIRFSVQNLKQSKIRELDRYFLFPTLVPFSLRGLSNYRAFTMSGLPTELEASNYVFIKPRLFVSSSKEAGIYAYLTGEADEVVLSVPMAFVDGRVSALSPLSGTGGDNAAVGLPPSFMIQNLAALEDSIRPRQLMTLPIDVPSIVLTWRGLDFYGSNLKFSGNCPVNELFRVDFRGSASLFKELLDNAAIHDGEVQVIARERTVISVPKMKVSVSIPPERFAETLNEKIRVFPQRNIPTTGQNGFELPVIEEQVVNSFFSILQSLISGFSNNYSSEMATLFDSINRNFFHSIGKCGEIERCRPMRTSPTQHGWFNYSYMETYPVSVPIVTQSLAALGPVSNSSKFKANPAYEEIFLSDRPSWLRGRSDEELRNLCDEFINIHNRGEFPYIAETTTAEQRRRIEQQLALLNRYTADQRVVSQAYCENLIYLVGALALTQESYFQLGTNTVVYPGAWVRFDIEKIAEFTTELDESRFTDMLALANVNPTVCIDGVRTACLRYASREVPVRNRDGSPRLQENGQPVMQSFLEYDCDPNDQRTYCPYSGTFSRIVGQDVEQECHRENYEEQGLSLLFGLIRFNSVTGSRLVCRERSRRNILSEVTVAACPGYAPSDYTGPLSPAETTCLRPRYRCAEWNLNCTRYGVNENFLFVHDSEFPRWKPYRIEDGIYGRGEIADFLFLKFAWPGGSVKNCRLSEFQREFNGNTWFIKIPTPEEEQGDHHPRLPCQNDMGQPTAIWNEHNTTAGSFPKMYLKNKYTYTKDIKCGKTEYTYQIREVLNQNMIPSVIPPQYQVREADVRIGPVVGSCKAQTFIQIGQDYHTTVRPWVSIEGRVSVLGRMLESIIRH